MARLINDEMPHRIAEKIRRAVADVPIPALLRSARPTRRTARICAKALRSNRTSAKADGYDVAHYDPMVPEMGFSSLLEAVKGADLVAVLVCHDGIKRDLTSNRKAIEQAMRYDRIVSSMNSYSRFEQPIFLDHP